KTSNSSLTGSTFALAGAREDLFDMRATVIRNSHNAISLQLDAPAQRHRWVGTSYSGRGRFVTKQKSAPPLAVARGLPAG
ncbi:MAG: hypothetical protein J2P48_20790, partial [Alphaproteobacteria bacterium]|nr:hypothetical protein [Alphaproteobacteria bacterium]